MSQSEIVKLWLSECKSGADGHLGSFFLWTVVPVLDVEQSDRNDSSNSIDNDRGREFEFVIVGDESALLFISFSFGIMRGSKG